MQAKNDIQKAEILTRYIVALNVALEKSRFASVKEFSESMKSEESHYQKIFALKKSINVITLGTVIEGLELSMSKFGSIYDSITEDDIARIKAKIEKNKRTRQKKM